MKMVKKYVSLFIVFAMITSLLFGCKGDATNSNVMQETTDITVADSSDSSKVEAVEEIDPYEETLDKFAEMVRKKKTKV